MKIIRYEDLEESKRFESKDINTANVKKILDDIRSNGDEAVRKYTKKFDRVTLETFQVDKQEFEKAYRTVKKESLIALHKAERNLEFFAKKQIEQLKDFEVETDHGVITGQRVFPLQRVGVYVPGGFFPLVSSLLMGAIPARVAGVKEIVVCTPPGPDGKVNPYILAAAYIAGVKELYSIGGVQAIGAMAYGTQSMKPVDKIVGPGNAYVTAAKKEVFGIVGIDFIAGPSEVMVLADEEADPVWIAADLLAQAEHDFLAVPILVTSSEKLANRVSLDLEKQLKTLATRDIAMKSIETYGMIVLVENMNFAIEYANKRAPEHLEIHVMNPLAYINKLVNYGTLFIGKDSAEVLGDYTSGLNHTLPTSGAARYTGGLSVRDFVKVLTTLKVSSVGLTEIGYEASVLARMEGLSAHENAVNYRLSGSK